MPSENENITEIVTNYDEHLSQKAISRSSSNKDLSGLEVLAKL